MSATPTHYDPESLVTEISHPERKTIEAWRDEKKTPDWLFAAVVAGYRYPVGKELTEAEYDEAVDRTANIPIGYHLPK